jgi:hypothetical protein
MEHELWVGGIMHWSYYTRFFLGCFKGANVNDKEAVLSNHFLSSIAYVRIQ